MKFISNMGLVTGCAVMLVSTVAFAADTSIRGILDRVDGKTFHIVDSKGHGKTVRLNDQTMIVSNETRSRLEAKWLRAGFRVNAVERNGRLMVLVVEEVPK